MKVIISFSFFTFFTVSSFGQSFQDSDVKIIQELYGKSKNNLIAEYMDLQSSDQVVFDQKYAEYESVRKELGQKKAKIIREYLENYDSLDKKKSDSLMLANLRNDMDLLKLNKKTYTRMKKVLGPIKAAKFLQLEVYFQTLIKGELQNSIPYIGELQKAE